MSRAGEFTCDVRQLGDRKTPAKITLLGDKTVRPEPAQHVIEFPGGAVEVSRCEDGTYWAHIVINRGDAQPDTRGRAGSRARVVASRIGRRVPGRVVEELDVPDLGEVEQIAVLVRVEPS